MKHTLSIGMITCRDEPQVEWFIESLMRQMVDGDRIVQFILVDHRATGITRGDIGAGIEFVRAEPKPTIWSGKHRVTSEDWWSASNDRNTVLALATGEYVCFVDDRCVLKDGWLQGIREAMEAQCCIFGSYEKRHNMKVEAGLIVDEGTTVSVDNRIGDQKSLGFPNPCDAPSSWSYGCTICLPREWALYIGGFEQALDGMSAEDTHFGRMMYLNGFPMKFDSRMVMIEDRTPGQCGPTMRREDKGVSPQDKSHKALEVFNLARQTSNRHQLLMSREAALAGRPWPVLLDAREDWFDGEMITTEYMKR